MECLAKRFYHSPHLPDNHDWLFFSIFGRTDFRKHDVFAACTSCKFCRIHLFHCFCLPNGFLFGSGCCSFGQLFYSLFSGRHGNISSLDNGGYISNYNCCLSNWELYFQSSKGCSAEPKCRQTNTKQRAHHSCCQRSSFRYFNWKKTDAKLCETDE